MYAKMHLTHIIFYKNPNLTETKINNDPKNNHKVGDGKKSICENYFSYQNLYNTLCNVKSLKFCNNFDNRDK